MKIKFFISFLLAIWISGCAFPGAMSRVSHTDFVYPNSNVEQTSSRQVEGSSHKLCGIFLFSWGAPDLDMLDRAVEEAKSRGGADLLINAQYSSKITFIPYLFSICSTNVSGYPARMEIGKQELR